MLQRTSRLLTSPLLRRSYPAPFPTALRIPSSPLPRLHRFQSTATSQDPITPTDPHVNLEPKEKKNENKEEAPQTPIPKADPKMEEKDKEVARLKDSLLRSLADFENLQKITIREKANSKDYAITQFAKDVISSMDILTLALRSIPASKLTPPEDSNPDLISLWTGVDMTKKELEKVLNKYGVKGFDPTGEKFDPNLHEALFQAPVPGKEPGSVLECQLIGYMIKDRLLRAAQVGVVLDPSSQ